MSLGVFYKLRDKGRSKESAYFLERSKESAYVLVGFFAHSSVSFISHVVRYAPFSTDKSSSLRNPAKPNL